MIDGEVYGAGDIDTEFTIQSISKPFAYAMALADRGFAPVLAKVGVEPSGEAFNEISLESDTGRPRNPMINAGAITVHSLAGPEGLNATERVERVADGLSAFAGRRLGTDDAVHASEMKHAHRNLAIAHMLRSHDILVEDARAVVDGYTRQCSALVSTRDLAMTAATLANRGMNPLSGEQVVPEPVVRQVLSVMFGCGMYDAAGDWGTQVGIPAKSGVAGGLIGGHLGGLCRSPHGHRARAAVRRCLHRPEVGDLDVDRRDRGHHRLGLFRGGRRLLDQRLGPCLQHIRCSLPLQGPMVSPGESPEVSCFRLLAHGAGIREPVGDTVGERIGGLRPDGLAVS